MKVKRQSKILELIRNNDIETQEELQAPPALLTPKDKNNGIPEFWQDNPCYVKSKDFAVQCGKLCARLSQKNNIIITNYASQLSRSSGSVLLNLSEGVTPNISYKERILRFSISMREAHESISNLILIQEIYPNLVSEDEKNTLIQQAQEIIAILNKSIHTIKKKM